MASEVTSAGRTGFSSATKGMTSSRPVSPEIRHDSFDEIKAKRASNAERMQIIFNTLGQRVGQKLDVIA